MSRKIGKLTDPDPGLCSLLKGRDLQVEFIGRIIIYLVIFSDIL